MTAPQATSLSFSTEQLPAHDRLALWNDVFARTIVKAETKPNAEGPFRCDAKMRVLPGLGIASMAITAILCTRTREMRAADGNDDFVCIIPTNGPVQVVQPDREVIVDAGAMIVLSGAEIGDVVSRSMRRFLTFIIPARELEPMISDRAAILTGSIPRDNGALRLLAGYVGLLQQEDGLASPELQRRAVSHAYELAALALGATRDTAHQAAEGGVRAARLAAIRADALANLAQVRLSPKLIARRHNVTERYVHLLFADTGETFGDFVTAARVARARELLLDPAHGNRRISEIAGSVGYGDLSTFNRAFRRRYGAAPSDLRVQANRRTTPGNSVPNGTRSASTAIADSTQ